MCSFFIIGSPTSSFVIIHETHCTYGFNFFFDGNLYNFVPRAKTQPQPPTHPHIQIQRLFNFINASMNIFSSILFNFSMQKMICYLQKMFAFLFVTLGKIFEKGATRWGQILHILIMFVKLFVSISFACYY
jgi:hypothetical protein